MYPAHQPRPPYDTPIQNYSIFTRKKSGISPLNKRGGSPLTPHPSGQQRVWVEWSPCGRIMDQTCPDSPSRNFLFMKTIELGNRMNQSTREFLMSLQRTRTQKNADFTLRLEKVLKTHSLYEDMACTATRMKTKFKALESFQKQKTCQHSFHQRLLCWRSVNKCFRTGSISLMR